MNGLDQDMMQRNLSCKNFRDSQKNMITSGISQFFVILLFLMLGVLLYTFTARQGIENPGKSDELFPMIATGNYFPGIVGILFIILAFICPITTMVSMPVFKSDISFGVAQVPISIMFMALCGLCTSIMWGTSGWRS